jgi:prepilin-type N-terminal cleavage/methylation domain-containing protein
MKNDKSRGFTLIELLVVITIVAALAALIFALASRAINSAEKAVCVTNLRSVGNAVQMYVSERNGRLPGPLNTGQSALYNKNDSRSLLTYIGPYLDEVRDSEPYLMPNYGCPSLTKRLQNNTVSTPAIVYRLEDRQTKLLDTETPRPNDISYPWGYNAGARPKRIDEISPASASKVRMITEQNQTLGVGGWSNGGAPGPAHGDESMAIFWDFSVRAVKLKQL